MLAVGFSRSRRYAWLSGFAGLPRWSGIRTYRQRQGVASMVFRGSGLCHQQRKFFFSSILDQFEGFFDRTDDECVLVHAHCGRRLRNLVVEVFIEFDGNLNVVHMHLLNHFYPHYR